MPDTGIRYSMNKFTGDGVTVTREISFSGGYLLASHVKSYYTNDLGAAVDVPFTFAGPNTITTTAPVPTGRIHVVYRATPVTGPYADFTDGAGITEANLDSNAKQAVFAAAELTDAFNEQLNGAQIYAADALVSKAAAAASASAADASADAALASQTAAAASAAAADVSEAAALASQNAAATSEATATVKAAAALASEGIATTKAAEAAASAATATAQAGTATTQAGIATTKAGEASASATAASTSASAAATSETNAAASAASAAALLDNFDDRYLGPKAADPTLDNDGNALVVGALYWRTTAPAVMRVYTASGWVDASAANVASFVVYEYVATAGQTTFTGASLAGPALAYVVGNIIVTLNGAVLQAADYTATTTSSVVLAVGAAVNDEVKIIAYNSFDVANTYTKAEADGKYVGYAGLTVGAGLSKSGSAAAAAIAVTPAAFSAYRTGGNQSVTSGATTIVQINAEEFDSAGCYDTANYRITPNIAGWHQLDASIFVTGTSMTTCLVMLYKNGSELRRGFQVVGSSLSAVSMPVSSLAYFNGATDYIDVRIVVVGTTPAVNTANFTGFLVRAA